MKDLRNINYGKALREIRKRKGWTIEVLAAKSGINDKHVGVLERGEKSPTLRTIDDLATALGSRHLEFFKYF